jgi:hypothetical protein
MKKQRMKATQALPNKTKGNSKTRSKTSKTTGINRALFKEEKGM